MLQKAWSYSALSSFETCPRRYYFTKVSKQVMEPQTEATMWGNKVHSALEKYAKREAALPEQMEKWGPYVDKIMSREGKPVIEQKMAINSSFHPTKWFAKDVWCRGIIDIGKVGERKAWLYDWKTGKHDPTTDQLKLFAGMAFAHFPWIEEVTTGFIWLKVGKFDKENFTRDQVQDIWAEFLPRTERLDVAFNENKWVPRPSGLCKKWCPVGRTLCEYCGV